MTVQHHLSHRRPEQAFVLPTIAEALGSEFHAVESTGSARSTLRFVGNESSGRIGWYDISMVRPGFLLSAAEVKHLAPVQRRYGCDEFLKLHFCISGGSHIDGDHGGSADVQAASLVCFTQPKDSEKRERVLENIQERHVTLACSRDYLSDVVDNFGMTLPQHILDFVSGRSLPFLCEQSALPLHIRTLVEDIMTVRNSSMEHLLREARGLELLGAALTHLASLSDARPLRGRDFERVQHVCELIDGEGSHSLNIKELSHRVAWNETQMMDCFKKVTGETISGYRQKQRMKMAMLRLRTSDVSVTELAFDLGYEHPGNFATAFKKMYGYSPKDARKNRLS